LTALGARFDLHLVGDAMTNLSMGFFSICEHFHAVLIVSLAFTVVAMLLAMWKKTRPSVYCMFVSVLLQAVIASYPTCASVVDLQGHRSGIVLRPEPENEARTETYFGRKTSGLRGDVEMATGRGAIVFHAEPR